ncbi:sodium:calcium antiporter [Methanocella sp. CWC-04]|uniref:Sodium:calcium antiporter n=1 Tax=Methanooceanicella nereidis TaxID=2052831 RepID=A0AAP2R9Z1_9EURY|nr:sodium:calcium antiporter [Methanocella sp. CWC-04]MCD1293643.1 sodium:calcium antiporter [Methanocella sp. CWC-04]
MNAAIFVLNFIAIIVGCELFTNGIEWLGKHFRLSDDAIGSVLAAIGTSLPETLIPLVAILFLGGDLGEEIGTGAILGSPFTLSTLALFLCAVSMIVFYKKRGTFSLNINGSTLRHSLKFFIIAYSIAAMTALMPLGLSGLKPFIAISLLSAYVIYSIYALREKNTGKGEEIEELYFIRIAEAFKKLSARGRSQRNPEVKADMPTEKPSLPGILFQVAVSLCIIIVAADLFVNHIKDISEYFGIAPLVMAIVISPMATELPEMFNSMIWIRERKDTFALGNILGAMVFQSCVVVTIGIMLTSWHIDLSTSEQIFQGIGILFAIFSAVLLYVQSYRNEVNIPVLFIGGLLYLIFFAIVFTNI